LRAVQKVLFARAGNAASFDAYRVAASHDLDVAGTAADDDFLDTLGLDAAGAIRPKLAVISPGQGSCGAHGEQ
jgi:hypothetical protein